MRKSERMASRKWDRARRSRTWEGRRRPVLDAAFWAAVRVVLVVVVPQLLEEEVGSGLIVATIASWGCFDFDDDEAAAAMDMEGNVAPPKAERMILATS